MSRPLLTFTLLTFNQQRFIREAVQGALAQTYSPLEIIISDDCSTDRTYAIIKDAVSQYDGPHQIILNRNDTNLGIGGHVNRVVKLSSGELIIGAAGDDISLPQRTEKIYQVYIASGKNAKSISSSMIIIDKDGHRHGLYRAAPINQKELSLLWLVNNGGAGVYGCTQACAKDIFQFFGLLPRHLWQEDKVISFRSALMGKVQIIEEPLVLYRRHSQNVAKPLGNLRSIQALYTERKERAINIALVFRTWLADIEKMHSAFPHRKSYFEEIYNLILIKLDIIENEIAMFDASFWGRIKLLKEAILKKTALKIIRRSIVMFFIPPLYFIYLRIKRLWKLLLHADGNILIE